MNEEKFWTWYHKWWRGAPRKILNKLLKIADIDGNDEMAVSFWVAILGFLAILSFFNPSLTSSPGWVFAILWLLLWQVLFLHGKYRNETK